MQLRDNGLFVGWHNVELFSVPFSKRTTCTIGDGCAGDDGRMCASVSDSYAVLISIFCALDHDCWRKGAEDV